MASQNDKCAAKDNSRRQGNLTAVCAILPWKTQPAANSPDETPVSGNVQDSQIQIDSYDLIPQYAFLDGAEVKPIDKIKTAIDPGQSIHAVKPKLLSPAELHQLYDGTSVPQHRYLAPSLTAAVNCPAIAPDPAKWFAGISDINLSGVVGAWLNTNGSTAFEELKCIGLDPNTSQLTGVLTVKQSSGYCGGPSTAGSREFVAFWVDWGSGFQYEGTTSVVVHDFSTLPEAGLEYNVFLPIDLLSRLQSCSKGLKTVKARAVLSWNTPPSTIDPCAPVVWGNSLDGLIQISLDQAVSAGNRVPFLAAGPVDIDRIDAGGRIVHATIDALTGMAFGPNEDAPFGAEIALGSAAADSDATDLTFTFNSTVIEDCGYSPTQYVCDRTEVNRSATSSVNCAQAGFCLHANS